MKKTIRNAFSKFIIHACLPNPDYNSGQKKENNLCSRITAECDILLAIQTSSVDLCALHGIETHKTLLITVRGHRYKHLTWYHYMWHYRLICCACFIAISSSSSVHPLPSLPSVTPCSPRGNYEESQTVVLETRDSPPTVILQINCCRLNCTDRPSLKHRTIKSQHKREVCTLTGQAPK